MSVTSSSSAPGSLATCTKEEPSDSAAYFLLAPFRRGVVGVCAEGGREERAGRREGKS